MVGREPCIVYRETNKIKRLVFFSGSQKPGPRSYKSCAFIIKTQNHKFNVINLEPFASDPKRRDFYNIRHQY
jgi:hypothetical protein